MIYTTEQLNVTPAAVRFQLVAARESKLSKALTRNAESRLAVTACAVLATGHSDSTVQNSAILPQVRSFFRLPKNCLQRVYRLVHAVIRDRSVRHLVTLVIPTLAV